MYPDAELPVVEAVPMVVPEEEVDVVLVVVPELVEVLEVVVVVAPATVDPEVEVAVVPAPEVPLVIELAVVPAPEVEHPAIHNASRPVSKVRRMHTSAS